MGCFVESEFGMQTVVLEIEKNTVRYFLAK